MRACTALLARDLMNGLALAEHYTAYILIYFTANCLMGMKNG